MVCPSASRRLQDVSTPIIPVVGDWIRSVPGTINLGQGVAWYGPPDEVRAAVTNFFDDPTRHRYGSVAGSPFLHERIASKLTSENGCGLAGRGIVVTAGSNMGFLHAIMVIADPGDEIILPLPYYFNQEMAVRMLNCVPVGVETDDGYQICPARLRAAITPRTRAIVTISPNNPSGAVYPEAVLREVNAMCESAGIYHISDEAYEYFVYEGIQHFSPASIPGSEAHTISLFSLSKAYGFASWRIGYMLAPEHLLAGILKAQDTNLICPPLISQFAAAAALDCGAGYCRGKLEITSNVRSLVLKKLAELRDICGTPVSQGAFYVLLRVHTQLDSMILAERLIREHRVAVIPGGAFGLTHGCYLRVSFGTLDELSAVEGMERLVAGLKTIVGAGRSCRA